MKTNQSSLDRAFRVVAGGALIAAGLVWLTGVLGIVMAAVGGILVVTGIVGFCPIYALLGLNTCRMSASCSAKHGV
jgi:uncharacterized membrane protein